MTGRVVTLDVSRLRPGDVGPLTEMFVAMVDIMASGPAKGYDQAMSRRCGLDWLLGDIEKRRTAVRAALPYGMRDTARNELYKIATDCFIGLRDFVDYEERREVKLEDMRDDAKGDRFTREDSEWVNGADYISPEVCCNG